MTDKEKAIIMAYTGVCMLTGDKFQIFHKYIEDIMGRPIWTHEIGYLADEIKEKAKDDFMALCEDEEQEKIGKAVVIPEGATNGDVVKLLFPDAEIQPIMGYFDKNELLGYRTYIGGRSQDYLLDWWNAKYKKEVEE